MQTETMFSNYESIEQSASQLAEHVAVEDDAIERLDAEYFTICSIP